MTSTRPASPDSTFTVVVTRHGRPALVALHRIVAEAKAHDPLAPVTVVVPGNMVGLAARRALASGDFGPVVGDRPGLVGVTFLTAYRLAELLGADAMAAAGRRPVSTPVIAAAVRRSLRRPPGWFAAVAEHPTTERRLVEAHRELSDLDEAELAALEGQSRRAAAVVDIHRSVTAILADDFHHEQDLARVAAGLIGAKPDIARDLGHVVVFAPEELGASRAGLLAELAAAVPSTLVLPLTGHEDADAGPRRAAALLGVDPGPAPPPEPMPEIGVISVSDADDEVRHVVRGVLAAADEGVPFDRMAVLYASRNPYLRLLDDHLTSAGLPYNGAAVTTLAESAVGRTLRRLLALPDRDFRREEVLGLVSATPIQWRGRPVPVRAWDKLSRDGGVVRGLGDWRRRLAIHADDLRSEVSRLGPDPDAEWRVRRFERDIAFAEQLTDFVEELGTALERLAATPTWRGRARACRRLVERLLGERDDWPEAEQDAAARLDLVLDRLGGLDRVEANASLAVFRRTLELELDGGLGRIGSFGNGVLVGPAVMAGGLQLDRVWILGMSEGSFPSRTRDDSMLPDRERSAVPALRLRRERVGDEHRHLLGALAAVTSTGRAVLVTPRGDLRQSNERAASRWLVDVVKQRTGSASVVAADVDDLDEPWMRHVASFASGLRSAPFPATHQEIELQTLVDADDRGEDLGGHPLLAARPALAAGAEAQRERGGTSFSRFDGNIGRVAIAAPGVDGRPISATALETWARCPYQFFLRQILGIAPLETPEQRVRIDAITKGSLIHDILDAFVAERVGSEIPPLVEDRARLHEIAAQKFVETHARGLTGEALYWRREQLLIGRMLDTWLEVERERGTAGGLEPLHTELRFGMGGAQPVPIATPSGAVINLRGAIDRIDRDGEGRLQVLDYKTGSRSKVSEDDPHVKGTRLQLLLYAHAAAHELGGEPESVFSGYWFLRARADQQIAGYITTPSIARTVLDAVDVIIDGIGRGRFPQHPDPTTRTQWVPCEYCDPDGLGVAEAERRFLRKAHDPELEPYVALARPTLLAAPTLDIGDQT
ncbi:MAG: PD-(D/E)XK nuclease family protein [Actinomycetota bacterium]